MIPIEALRSVTQIIVHAGCADGTAAAMILRDALPDATITAVGYGPERDALEPEPHMLFCDMTPPFAKALDFHRAGAIVLDHHSGQRDITESFADRGLGVYADAVEEPGVSGAMLAYREVWWRLRPERPDDGLGSNVLQFARLVGIRDTWQTEHPDWRAACAHSLVLLFYPLQRFIEGKRQPYLTFEEALLGWDLLKRREARVMEVASTGCLWLSPSVVLFNDLPKPDSLISDVAEHLRHSQPDVQLVCGFFYKVTDGRLYLEMNLRSTPGPDKDLPTALQIAQVNGGGGHEHAAGFVKLAHDERWRLVDDISPVHYLSLALARTSSGECL